MFFFLFLFFFNYFFFFFFFNDTAPTEIYTLSLHDALPIRARGSEGVGRPDQRADVAGILNAVDHQRHRPRRRRQVGRGPAPRLDDREDPLGRLGVGQLREHARADLLHLDRVALELRDECRAARGARQVGADQGPLERDAGGQRFLHEPDTLDQGEAAAAARLATLEITDRRLQITGDESPR